MTFGAKMFCESKICAREKCNDNLSVNGVAIYASAPVEDDSSPFVFADSRDSMESSGAIRASEIAYTMTEKTLS